jgi:hypothetical protein
MAVGIARTTYHHTIVEWVFLASAAVPLVNSEAVEKTRAACDAREVSNDRFDPIENKIGFIAANLGHLLPKASRPKRVSG